MDSLRIGFFHDSTKRDHACTLLGLEDAYRRARSTSSSFRADARDGGTAPDAAPDAAEDFTTFDAISLEPEFSRHPILRESLFLFDSAVDFSEYPWRSGEFDEVGRLPRVAALDVRAWSAFSVIFNRDIPLLPAPMAPFRGAVTGRTRPIVVIVNDLALSRRALAEIRAAIRLAEPDTAVVEVLNPYLSPMRQSQWLDADLQSASAHLHVGLPCDTVSFGRLIDSMNMRVPCVVFEGGRNPNDFDASIVWRRPVFQCDVHVVGVASIKALGEAVRLVVRDRTWAQHLTRNALREVMNFQEQIQNSLLPAKFVETYATLSP